MTTTRQVLHIIDRMISPLGRRVDYDHPMVDARLPDGSRVNAVIPPSAVDGPCITIRKFLQNRMTMEDLIRIGTLTENMAEFLQACVVARLNIIISGPTSSGKTTFLNVLSRLYPGPAAHRHDRRCGRAQAPAAPRHPAGDQEPPISTARAR